MRKGLLCTLIMLLICLLAVSVSAQEHDHCLCCGSCEDLTAHSCAAVAWQPLPANTTDFGKLAAGNYYLTSDVTVKSMSEIKNDLSICLNGYNITTTANRCFGRSEEHTSELQSLG